MCVCVAVVGFMCVCVYGRVGGVSDDDELLRGGSDMRNENYTPSAAPTTIIHHHQPRGNMLPVVLWCHGSVEALHWLYPQGQRGHMENDEED